VYNAWSGPSLVLIGSNLRLFVILKIKDVSSPPRAMLVSPPPPPSSYIIEVSLAQPQEEYPPIITLSFSFIPSIYMTIMLGIENAYFFSKKSTTEEDIGS
jgi:hypothetical protein